MTAYNKTFELTIEDLDVIETALLEKKRELALEDQASGDARQIHDLLGRLHNQKVFYRPKNDVYVGG
ncbi:hypothetical protein [Nereida sp. MMG025]|uniref:hypothetical protein n=1 Tax=Nereida sp. MMG025 TaxID=2909981 RepID=UPI001F1B3E94|nr:hypothetical protein [Nereida sp. MMG025]MCF6443867.1 hypothetical protein [Nereida sp. MMG025]